MPPKADPMALLMAAGVFHLFVLQWLAMQVNNARVRYGVPWPYLYAERSHPMAIPYNCAQRAHQHTLEATVTAAIAGAIASSEYPLCAGAGLALWSFSKVIGNVLGYGSGKASRKGWGTFGYLGLLPVTGLAIFAMLKRFGLEPQEAVDAVKPYVDDAVEKATPYALLAAEKAQEAAVVAAEKTKEAAAAAAVAAEPYIAQAQEAATPYVAMAREKAEELASRPASPNAAPLSRRAAHSPTHCSRCRRAPASWRARRADLGGRRPPHGRVPCHAEELAWEASGRRAGGHERSARVRKVDY